MTTVVQVEQEIWRNPGAGRVVVLKLDHRGELAVEEMVGAGRTVALTSQERALNQARAWNHDLDVFRNGTLVPVRLIEGSEIEREVAANPNLLSDGDMRAVVSGKGKNKDAANSVFRDRLAEITNATTLNRLLALAEEEDAPVSRVRAIQARLNEVEGLGQPVASGRSIDGPAVVGTGGREPASVPVTPR